MSDAVLTRDGPVSVPLNYVVPAGGELLPLTVEAVLDGTSATGPFYAILEVISPSGNSMGKYRSDAIAAGASADVTWFPGAELEEEAGSLVGFVTESLLLDTRNSSGVTSSQTLQAGQEYVITAQGTFSYVNQNLDVGTPNADALFPTSPPPSRSSTQVGFDPECVFAYYSGSPPVSGIGHSTINFQMDLGSGFTYVAPQDGTHATPAPNYLYTYKVVGQGHTASFIFHDQPGQFSDNYGYIQVTIQSVNGSSGGGGGGSLVPPVGANGDVLEVVSGVPTWAASSSVIPDVVFVAAPTGVAATDNAALAAAVTACPTGGMVQMQAGTYALIDAGTTSTLALNKNLTLRGWGGADALWAHIGTLLTVDHATAVGITISAHGVRVQDFAIQNIHGTAPTGGAGIETVTGGGNSTHYGPNLSVRGFYYNIDHQAGNEWFMDTSVFSYDFVYCGLRLQNVDNTDGGDAWISGQFVAGPTNNATACILWMTGGGTKLVGVKCNTRSGKTVTTGVGMELQDGVTTSDFQMTGCSIENANWGFLLEHQGGGANTGVLSNLLIQGSEFLCLGGAGTQAVAIAPAVTSRVSAVNVAGNVIVSSSAAQNGIYLANSNNVSHGPNVFVTNAGYHDAGGNTNVTSVGNG